MNTVQNYEESLVPFAFLLQTTLQHLRNVPTTKSYHRLSENEGPENQLIIYLVNWSV